ncbi:5-oxoprolinase subunit PxpB [Aliivibrio sifiae]|uniref:5-oxoprolinase subunit PxpB n=1 Tax=Aliivibrio sifiae TaxID=566293 RepID=UPI003D128ACE
MMKISAVSEASVLVVFSDMVSPDTADIIAQSAAMIEQESDLFVIDMVPSYTSILITYDLTRIELRSFMSRLNLCLQKSNECGQLSSSSVVIELPVYYGKEVSLDAEEISRHTGLSFDEIVSIHSSQEYRVYAIGFAPGFAYLGNTDPRIHIPRKSTPRLSVPAGSLAIAEQQTAIYPKSSPGGWQVIGRTPINLIDFNRENLTVFEMGAKVIFKPISREEYIAMGGEISEALLEEGTHNV